MPKLLRRTRAVIPKRLLLVLLICLLAIPVTTQPDHVCCCPEPIITLVAATILVGQHIVTFSSMLIGPSMGISSVL